MKRINTNIEESKLQDYSKDRVEMMTIHTIKIKTDVIVDRED